MKPTFGMSAPRGRGWWILAVCLTLVALLSVGIKLSRARSKSVVPLSPLQIGERAQQLGGFLGEEVTLEDPPVFIAPSCWTVNCRSEDMQIFMMLDVTGHLQRLRTSFDPHALARQVAPIETAAEAQEVALHRLADLQMFVPGSHTAWDQAPVRRNRIAWNQPPAYVASTDVWQMAWTVTPRAEAPPYRLALVLDRRTGIPVLLWRGPVKRAGLALNP